MNTIFLDKMGGATSKMPSLLLRANVNIFLKLKVKGVSLNPEHCCPHAESGFQQSLLPRSAKGKGGKGGQHVPLEDCWNQGT